MVAFFHPVDNTNERYEELTEHPDWSFYGPQFPTKESLLAARDRMFAKHPHTTFVALHMANWPENLDYVSHLLDTLPNVMVEFGAREAELGRQPRRARELRNSSSDCEAAQKTASISSSSVGNSSTVEQRTLTPLI